MVVRYLSPLLFPTIPIRRKLYNRIFPWLFFSNSWILWTLFIKKERAKDNWIHINVHGYSKRIEKSNICFPNRPGECLSNSPHKFRFRDIGMLTAIKCAPCRSKCICLPGKKKERTNLIVPLHICMHGIMWQMWSWSCHTGCRRCDPQLNPRVFELVRVFVYRLTIW